MKRQGYVIQQKEVTTQMEIDPKNTRNSTSTQSAQSPAAQRNAKKPNNVDPDAAQNAKSTVSHISAPSIGLQASIGDLQSINEELLLVNHKLRDKLGEISRLYMDPERLMTASESATADNGQLKEAQEKLAELSETSAQRIRELTQGLDKVKAKLSQARDLFYELFETNPIPTVLIRQEDETFLYANVEFLNYFQVQGDQVIGRSASEFTLDLGLRLNVQEELRKQLKQESRIRNIEFEIRHPSGETRIILASLQVLVLDETNALITTFIDITERVHAEQQIRALASELTATEQAERHRLSQVLHDDLQQRIFAVQMQLSFLRDAYEKNDLKAFQVDFPQLEEWLAEAIKVTRQLSVDLSPPILHGEGLVEAVVWLSAQMNEQYGLKVDIKTKGAPAEMDEKVRVLTFHAIRELLFNIVKHAETLEAAIRFEQDNSRLLVTVRDRGTGFESTKVMNNPQVAHGLLVIRDRLNLLGCKMEINSQPGIGTEAIIEVPYENLEP